MNSNETERGLQEVFSVVLGHPVGPDVARVNEPAWDSLKHMQLVFAVEEKFGVQFPEEAIPQLNSLASFAEHLRPHHAP